MERKQGAHANFTPCKMLVPKRSKLRGRWARGGERDAHTARTKSDRTACRTGIDYDRADPTPNRVHADWHCRRSAHSPQKRRGLRSHPLQLQEGPTRGAKRFRAVRVTLNLDRVISNGDITSARTYMNDATRHRHT